MCQIAATRGVAVAIEPINRYEGHPGFMNSVTDAMSVIDEVGAQNLGVLVDFFHANIEDVSLGGAIRQTADRLLNVHLCDSNRDAPGTGHIDFLEVFRTLDDIDYRGYLSLGFVPSRLDVRLLREALLERSLSYLKELEQIVVLQKRTYQSPD